MDEPKTHGRRSDIPWEEIRAAYAAGIVEPTQLAKRFGCSARSIRRRRVAEKWPTTTDAIQAVTANVIDIKTRAALERVGDEVEKAVASGLLHHAELEELLLELAKTTLKRAIGSKLRAGTHTSEASEIKDAIAAAMLALQASREINGRRTGEKSVEDDRVTDRTFRFVLPAVAPPKEQTA